MMLFRLNNLDLEAPLEGLMVNAFGLNKMLFSIKTAQFGCCESSRRLFTSGHSGLGKPI